jgi:serine/threonine protein phosphatase PrpC
VNPVSMKLRACTISETGPVRKSNEDFVGAFPDLDLFVVADGMGGHADGDVASRMAVETIQRFFAEGADGSRPDGERLKLAVELAHRRIYEEGLRRGGESPGRSLGTTVVALKIAPDERRASWVHVGDSRLYRLRGGRLDLLTADHTLFGQEYREGGSIPAALPHTNRLTQALGVSERVDVAAASAAIVPGDLFLLCTDGISGQIEPSVLETELGAGDDLQSIAEALVRLSLEAGGKDNASAVLVRAVEG